MQGLHNYLEQGGKMSQICTKNKTSGEEQLIVLIIVLLLLSTPIS